VFRKLSRFITDRTYRETRWFYRQRPADLLQPSNVTMFDRYPEIFSFVQGQLGDDSELNILSFGCSTGEEVFSLRQYFSHATIRGIDINPGNIRICKRRLRKLNDERIQFYIAGTLAAESTASFDAIFCMAVLRHSRLGRPGVIRSNHVFPFEAFSRTIESFRRCLKPGGLLVMRHNNFRLCDSAAGADFETILSIDDSGSERKTPLFGPDNRLLPGTSYPDTVFRMKASSALARSS
jgi:SAM-dependent methyltransferase